MNDLSQNDKLDLCRRVMQERPSNLYAHARRELLDPGDDEVQKAVNKAILEMILVFASQGHSGSSAPYVVGHLTKLLMFEPIRPLTGEDREWVEVGSGVFQNARCGHVFKDADRFNGQAYDIQGRIFRDPDGSTWTNGDSCVPITFPYTPTSVTVDRP